MNYSTLIQTGANTIKKYYIQYDEGSYYAGTTSEDKKTKENKKVENIKEATIWCFPIVFHENSEKSIGFEKDSGYLKRLKAAEEALVNKQKIETVMPESTEHF